jgi:hypothetical protein
MLSASAWISTIAVISALLTELLASGDISR